MKEEEENIIVVVGIGSEEAGEEEAGEEEVGEEAAGEVDAKQRRV